MKYQNSPNEICCYKCVIALSEVLGVGRKVLELIHHEDRYLYITLKGENFVVENYSLLAQNVTFPQRSFSL